MNHNELKKNMIFALLDRIEDQTGVMAHEDDRIKNELKRWQNNELKDSYFKELLNKYHDDLNN